MKLGDRVKVLNGLGSNNKTGDTGVITEVIDRGFGAIYRVTVEGRKKYGNWRIESQLELIEEADNINPKHYKNMSVEVIDMMLSIYGKEKVKVFCELNAFKYRMRLGSKEGNSIEQEHNNIKWYEDKIKELC